MNIDIDDLDFFVQNDTNVEIEKLRTNLKEASQKYHSNGNSGVSDAIWDSWYYRLSELSPNDPLLTEVGNGYELDEEDSEDIVKEDHPIVVGSIVKEKDPEVIRKKIGKESTWSVKLDGNSYVAYYEYGELTKVLSRGKNNRGINRTSKFKKIIPNTIECKLPYIAVRGEAAILKKNYTTENGFDTTLSSRNTVAGLIARQEDWEEQFKFVDFIAYTFIDANSKKSIYNYYDWSKEFKVEKQKSCKIFMEMSFEEFHEKYKLNWEYDSDGTVFIFDDGSMLALKYKDESVETDLEGIQWTIGVDQRLTPVAKLKPVKLAGATISKASLGSFDRVRNLGLWPFGNNPKVSIIRSNEIIPYVTSIVSIGKGIIEDTRNPLCPCCLTESTIEGKHAYCKNPECSNVENSALLKFSSFFYPDGLSDKQIEKIFKHYNIKTIVQLLQFKYKALDFTKIDGVGRSLAHLVEVFFDNISGDIDSKIIYQSVITSCGSSIAKTIVKSGVKITNIFTDMAWFDELDMIPGFNSKVLHQLLDKKDTIQKICSLRNVIDDTPKEIKGSYCVTGIRFSKEQVDKLSIAGWVEDSSAKKTTTVVVTNDIYGSSTKIEKAKKYGIPVIEINQFFEDYVDQD